ncbi:MAG: class III poly(R)-hydroxyalkanoic acid synthase subunit PhaC [Cyanobacteria bacterium]|nr:class III poly(R)-hydroxyalkanoic acid synthase subunit PhaC [Cyanobacteriota bacterium]
MYEMPEQFQKQILEEQLKAIQKVKQGIHLSQEWKAKVGQTPHDVVFHDGKISLLHYHPTKTGLKHKTPLLIVFSLINRSYILDLKPGKSVVEKFVEAGYDVYMIDWGVPGKGDQFLTLDDYVNRYLYRITEFMKEDAQVSQISMLGYCMGGTLAGMFTALHPESIKNLILLASPFDFSQGDGVLNLWADKKHFNVHKLVDALGNIPPWFLQSSFNLMKPMQNLWGKYVTFYEKIEDEQFVDDFLTLEYWLNDNIPLPGKVYQQFVEDCFHHNRLIHNKMRLGTHAVDLSHITCPVLSIVAKSDHLVPPCSSIPIHEVVGSKEAKVIEFPAGHIGLSVSGKAMKQLWPEVCEWLGPLSEATPSSKVTNSKATSKLSPNASRKTSKKKSDPNP